MTKLIIISVILGIATYVGISLLPDNMITLQETLLRPGLLISSVIWKEGAHSDHAIYWLLLAVSFNVIIYSFVWGVAIFIVRKLRHR